MSRPSWTKATQGLPSPPRQWPRSAITACWPRRCSWCWRFCWPCWPGHPGRLLPACFQRHRSRYAISAAWDPRLRPACFEPQAIPIPRGRGAASLCLGADMSNPDRRAPRASRLRIAVLATLSLPAAAFADAPTATHEPPDATTLDTIEVQGRRDADQAERALTPGGVTLVDGETFHQRPVTNMADALRYVPGVWIESGTGGDAAFISSRGSNLDATNYDSNGIKLFQDGLPVSSADGNNHNRFLDPAAARHVIVARGANALTYGASNLGGAIDFISPTARNSAPGQVALAAGSHGLWNGRLSGGGVSGDFDGQLTLEALGRDGYREHSQI